MLETPSIGPPSTTDFQTATAADGIDRSHHQQPQQPLAPEQPPMTDRLPASPFPGEHPTTEPAPRPCYHTPSDRRTPHPSAYPTAPNSLPPTPHPGMSAPSALRAPPDTPVDRKPHLSPYTVAPGTASPTAPPATSQAPQRGVSPAGLRVPPAASPTSRISFEGTFQPPPSPHLMLCLLGEKKRNRMSKQKKGNVSSKNGAMQTTSPSQKSPLNGATATMTKTG